MKQKMSVLSMAVLMLMVSATVVMVVSQAFSQDFNRALGMISPSGNAKLPQSNAPSTNAPTTLAPTTSSTGSAVPDNAKTSSSTTTNNTNSSQLVNPSTHTGGNYTSDDRSLNHTRWDE